MKTLIILMLVLTSFALQGQTVAVYDTTMGNRTFAYSTDYPIRIDIAKDGKLVMYTDVHKYVIVDNDTVSSYIIGIPVKFTVANDAAIKAAVLNTMQVRVKSKARKDDLKEPEE